MAAEVTLSDVSVNSLSDADFRLQASVANGLAVSMQDAPHLGFVWLNGAAVPRADVVPALLEEPEFPGGRGSPRFWLLISNAVLLSVLAVLCIKWLATRAAR